MMDYCVVIRTLGTAGEKYQQELNSLKAQFIKPKKILVYIPESYQLPKETIGEEQYIRCKKGMVAQRALGFEEVDTKYCLFLDDDVYLPPDAMKKMLEAITEMDGDCIAADTFKNQEMSLLGKVRAIITNWAIPRPNDKWAFKIGYTGTFSYNIQPSKDVYISQSAAGPCSLWRMKSYRKIHFEDELWMDKTGFAYGDDILFFHKLYRNGGKLLVHYTSGILHLDAQSSRKEYKADYKKFFVRSFMWFVIWWRSQYDPYDIIGYKKFLSVLYFSFKLIWDVLLHVIFSILHLSLSPLFFWLKGTWKGFKFVHSDEFKKIPNFVSERNQINDGC